MPGSPITFNSLDNTVLADTIGRATGGFLGDYKRNQQNKNEGTILQDVFHEIGQNPHYTTPDIMGALAKAQQQGVRPEAFKPYLDQFQKDQQLKQKQEEKIAPFRGALDTIARERELLSGGHIGSKIAFSGTGRDWGSTFNPFGSSAAQGQKDRSEYEQLAKSLISFSASLPIKNRLEFETLASDLYDVTRTKEETAGTLDAMERIIKNHLPEFQENPKMGERQQSERSGDVLQLRHKGSGKVAKVPKEKFLGLPVPEQELYEQI